MFYRHVDKFGCDYEVLVRLVSDEVRRGISEVELLDACRHGRYEDRRFLYEDITRKACCYSFRRYGGLLYWFTGEYWRVLSLDLLGDGLRLAFLDICGDYFGGIRGDISKCLSRLVSVWTRCPELGVSKSIVGFRNGVWEFCPDGSVVYHSFEERMPILGILPYDYDPDAVCPVWDSFLEQVLYPGQRVMLQKYLGLGCVDRRDMPHKVESTLWLIGSGANGKSTIQDVVTGVYGRDMVSCIRLDDLLNRDTDARMRSTAMILGKAFNYSDEVHESDISHSADTFKSLCSGDAQAARRLGHDIWVSDDVPFLICNMNERPQMKNLDKAIVRRLLQIRFPASVSEEDMDLELGSKLRSEYSGIRNWMLEGYRMLVRDDFSFVREKDAGDTMDVMLENGRTVDAFLLAHGLRHERRAGRLDEQCVWLLGRLLYEQYVRWCGGCGYVDIETERMFNKRMHKLCDFQKARAGICYALFCDGDVPDVLRY